MKLKELISKVSGDKSVTLFDQAVVSGSHFLISLLLARTFGAEIFGWFALGWMILMFASSLHQAFIITPLLTMLPKKDQSEKQAYTDGLKIINLLTVLIFAIISFCTLKFMNHYNVYEFDTDIILPFTALLLVYLVHDFLRKFFYATQTAVRSLRLDLIAYLPQLTVLSFFLFQGMDQLSNAVWIMAIGYLLGILAFINVLFPKRLQLKNAIQTTREHFKFSSWLIGKAVLQWWSGNYYILAAGALLGPVALGLVRMAQTLIGVLNIVFIAVENYVPVSAAKIFGTEGVISLKEYLFNVFKKAALPVLLVLGTVFILAKPLGILFFNESSTGFNVLLKGYAILYLLVFIAIPFRIYMRTVERTNILFWAYLLGTAFSLITANPIVKQFGYWGLAAGIIVNQILLIATFALSVSSEKKEEAFTLN